MSDFKDGVQWFTVGEAHFNVFFPEDKIRCQYCPFCRSESDLNRFWCRLTNSMIYNPYLDPPDTCPIEFTGEIRGTKKKGAK